MCEYSCWLRSKNSSSWIRMQCSTCPDSSSCARILDEKWRQAYNSCFRFGPCQPSMVYRYLRSLEGVSPPLALINLACQNTAKAFAATRMWFDPLSCMLITVCLVPVFDRMFSLGVRGSGTDTAPLGPRVPGAALLGPRRHFMYCSLKTWVSPWNVLTLYFSFSLFLQQQRLK